MGNRIKEGKCIMCGTPLIQPNSWHCCTACIPKIKELTLKIKANPDDKPKQRTRLIGGVPGD